jgi:hypothetical protein
MSAPYALTDVRFEAATGYTGSMTQDDRRVAREGKAMTGQVRNM